MMNFTFIFILERFNHTVFATAIEKGERKEKEVLILFHLIDSTHPILR